MVSSFTGFPVQPNKAIVGENAFRHEAGIHQHGVIMDRETYEIMEPQDVGWVETELTLGPRSGKHGVRQRLKDLGYQVTDEQMEDIYARFIEMADKKNQIYDEDLEILMREATTEMAETWSLAYLQVNSTTGTRSQATVRLRKEDQEYEKDAVGNGPVDAVYAAINLITEVQATLDDYSIRSVTRGKDALGEATVRIATDGESAIGRAASTDVIEASAAAYLNALNRLLIRSELGKKDAQDTP